MDRIKPSALNKAKTINKQDLSDSRTELFLLMDAISSDIDTIKTDIEKADKYYNYACNSITNSIKDMTYKELNEKYLNVVNEILDKYMVNTDNINIVEVKHSKWGIVTGYDIKKNVQCQNCFLMTFEPTKYCPHCGARMDGGDSK